MQVALHLWKFFFCNDTLQVWWYSQSYSTFPSIFRCTISWQNQPVPFPGSMVGSLKGTRRSLECSGRPSWACWSGTLMRGPRSGNSATAAQAFLHGTTKALFMRQLSERLKAYLIVDVEARFVTGWRWRVIATQAVHHCICSPCGSNGQQCLNMMIMNEEYVVRWAVVVQGILNVELVS